MTNRLIVVADHEKAHLFRAKGRKIHELIKEITNEEAGSCEPHSRREGLSQHMGGSCHFFNPHSQTKTIEKENFARFVSHEIYQNMANGGFEEFILVAEPKMLGMLRKSLKHYYNKTPIHKTLNLDATTLRMGELEERVFS